MRTRLATGVPLSGETRKVFPLRNEHRRARPGRRVPGPTVDGCWKGAVLARASEDALDALGSGAFDGRRRLKNRVPQWDPNASTSWRRETFRGGFAGSTGAMDRGTGPHRLPRHFLRRIQSWTRRPRPDPCWHGIAAPPVTIGQSSGPGMNAAARGLSPAIRVRSPRARSHPHLMGTCHAAGRPSGASAPAPEGRRPRSPGLRLSRRPPRGGWPGRLRSWPTCSLAVWALEEDWGAGVPFDGEGGIRTLDRA